MRLGGECGQPTPVEIPPAAYVFKIPVVVSTRARVSYDGRDCSMPPASLDRPATLHLCRDRIASVTKIGTVVQRQSPSELRPAAQCWLTGLVHRRRPA